MDLEDKRDRLGRGQERSDFDLAIDKANRSFNDFITTPIYKQWVKGKDAYELQFQAMAKFSCGHQISGPVSSHTLYG